MGFLEGSDTLKMFALHIKHIEIVAVLGHLYLYHYCNNSLSMLERCCTVRNSTFFTLVILYLCGLGVFSVFLPLTTIPGLSSEYE